MADQGKIKAINTYQGKLTSQKVAEDLDLLNAFQALEPLH